MDLQLFNRFAPVIQSLTPAEINNAEILQKKLELASSGQLRVCYAPFEYVNPEARLVLVGITPGQTQFSNAILEARQQLGRGRSPSEVLQASKKIAAFSGSLRPALIGMLNLIGLQHWLGIDSCEQLFGTATGLVHTTSVLRNPVFVDGKNYNGQPDMLKNGFLREQLLMHFGAEVRALPNAVFIPLGDKAAQALQFVGDHVGLDSGRILEGLPHPSGANGERIAYFLNRKARAELSTKTNATKLDAARAGVLKKVSVLVRASA